jgi:hypothetical protein
MFKVGDRVRIINRGEAKVIEITEGLLPYQVLFEDGDTEWMFNSEIEGLAIKEPTIINIGEVHLNLATIKFSTGHGISVHLPFPDNTPKEKPDKHEGLYILKGKCRWGRSQCLHEQPHKWFESTFVEDCSKHGCIPYVEANNER